MRSTEIRGLLFAELRNQCEQTERKLKLKTEDQG